MGSANRGWIMNRRTNKAAASALYVLVAIAGYLIVFSGDSSPFSIEVYVVGVVSGLILILLVDRRFGPDSNKE